MMCSYPAQSGCHAATCPVVCLFVPHDSTCCPPRLFPPCPDSPDSAVQVLSPTGKTPESKSTQRNWRILGITHAWWKTRWDATTPAALLTSKPVSTDSPSEEAHINRCPDVFSLAKREMKRSHRQQACDSGNAREEQLSTHAPVAH